jgi:FOG: EAL domain
MRNLLNYSQYGHSPTEREIMTAFNHGFVVPWYQPVVDVRRGEITSVEVLARMFFPDGRMIEPKSFMPFIERRGRTINLTRLMLKKVSEQISQHGNFARSLNIAINFTASHFSHHDFEADCRQFVEEVAEYGATLTVELTENECLSNDATVLSSMEKLRQRGVRFALDDFGTGFSNLIYLNQFCFDMLKIDKSFIEGISNEDLFPPVLGGIIAMTNEMGMTSIAEGVENIDQSRRLESKGVHFQQGFLFSRPVDFEDLMKMLRV